MRQATSTPSASRRKAIAVASRWACALAATTAGLLSAPASAQDTNWPTKPIKLIVPFPAGSFTDTVARVMSDSLSKSLGQPVIVDNKVGANGVIGVSEAARATPDGYTLMITNSSSITINPLIYRKIAYKPSDFTPITAILEAPFLLVVNPEWSKRNSIESVNDLVQFAKRNPGTLSYGSPGPGNIAHLSYAQLSNRAKISTVHVPYKSTAQAQLAVIAGELQTSFDTWGAIPHIKAGKLKALGVTAPKRLAQLPDVPTMEQAGMPDFNMTFWIGMLAPAGTPAPIVQKLSALSHAMLDDSRVKTALGMQGDVVMQEPAAFAKRIEAEIPAWAAVIKTEAIALD